METYNLLPGSFTLGKAGLDLILPEDTKCRWWVKQGEPAPRSPSIRIIPQELPAPCQLQGAAPLSGADLFSCKFNRAYENQVAVPAEEGSKKGNSATLEVQLEAAIMELVVIL